ncbi:unnamed protein product [Adineta ricciae]|uniref:G-protein coupled receptors family 1 profile domain-containing protein n=1 Tax=Adineta ricciae TaxID=249248 RepID=A0A815ZZT6_ADIRI|nr:unnamed protein product [Adineta ricciae]
MASWTRKPDVYPFEAIELVISAIVPIVLIVVGTLGNITSMIILMNKNNRRTSTNIYLIFLCLMDTISLYQWNLSNTLPSFPNSQQQIWGNSVIMCKLSEFFSFYTLHTSAMFLTLVELDRACLLRSRWYKRKIAQPSAALIVCAFVFVILFCVNGFLFGLGFEYSIYDNTTGLYQTYVACYYSMNQQLNDFFVIQYPWIHLVIMYFLPFGLIIICTLLTAKKLIFSQTATNEQITRSNQRNRRISIMLLLMCLTYVIATLPNRLCFSVFSSLILGHDYTDTVFISTNTLIAWLSTRHTLLNLKMLGETTGADLSDE